MGGAARKITAAVIERDYAARDVSAVEPDPSVVTPPDKLGGTDGES
jgi:hypothetical protein